MPPREMERKASTPTTEKKPGYHGFRMSSAKFAYVDLPWRASAPCKDAEPIYANAISDRVSLRQLEPIPTHG